MDGSSMLTMIITLCWICWIRVMRFGYDDDDVMKEDVEGMFTYPTRFES